MPRYRTTEGARRNLIGGGGRGLGGRVWVTTAGGEIASPASTQWTPDSSGSGAGRVGAHTRAGGGGSSGPQTVKGTAAGTFTATAYGPPWNAMEGGGTTSQGLKLTEAPSDKPEDQKLVVAVDPSVIPYGSKMLIQPNPFGDNGLIFTAGDTGGAFQGGKRKVDFFIASGRAKQNAWGKRSVKVYIVGKGSPTDVFSLADNASLGGNVKVGKDGLDLGSALLGPISQIPGAVEGVIPAVAGSAGDAVNEFLDALGYIFTQDFWKRFGLVFFGGVAVIASLLYLLNKTGAVDKIATVAGSVPLPETKAPAAAAKAAGAAKSAKAVVK